MPINLYSSGQHTELSRHDMCPILPRFPIVSTAPESTLKPFLIFFLCVTTHDMTTVPYDST